jgi:hypothetical protein
MIHNIAWQQLTTRMGIILKKVFTGFGFLTNKGYLLVIKLYNYVKEQHQGCKHNHRDSYNYESNQHPKNNLRINFRQHLSRWNVVPCTYVYQWNQTQQELFIQKKGSDLPQPIVERVVFSVKNSKSYIGSPVFGNPVWDFLFPVIRGRTDIAWQELYHLCMIH